MGAQQQRLGEVLATLGFRQTNKCARPKLADMPPKARDYVMELYHALGGIDPNPRLTPGPWDYAYDTNLVVELDESAHFNRYRAKTLEPPWAQHLPWYIAYTTYATTFEDACLKERGWGGYWTSTSTERQFGAAGPKGVLNGSGSPRWKQRALYDAMRDITAFHGDIRLVRLSVYDEVDSVTLGDSLTSKAPLNTEALHALIAERTVG